MTAIVTPATKIKRLPPLPVYRFSVDQYHRMAEVGILSSEDPLELLEGLLVIKGNSTLAPQICVLADPEELDSDDLALPIRRFTIDEYRGLFRTGIFREGEPVELLEGWIVRKMPRNPRHDAALSKLQNKLIAPLLPAQWFCRNQSAIQTDTSEPEPDLAIVRGSEFDYKDRHPRPRDLALVIEVADATLQIDRILKASLYARVGIPAYWIVNIPDGQVEVFTDPTGADPTPLYEQRNRFGLGEAVSLALNGQPIGQIPVQELFPT